MVQIGGLVQEFYVGESEKEQQGAQAVAVSGGNAKSQQAEGGKVGVHPPARPRLDPAKAEVGEVVGRLDVQFADPAVGKEPGHYEHAHQPEHDAEDCQ